jgi:SagB-type dehydrogenase family enzyme
VATIPLNLDTDNVRLPPPAASSAITLAQALEHRHSTRDFLPDPIELPALSALLWAAAGINRPETGGRTAPSAHNWQEIDVYVVMAEGAWRYDPRESQLLLVSAEDLRALTGTQDFVASAPLNLVYVADFGRMEGARDEDRAFLAGADAAFIAQNVYLHCASAGLAVVVRALIDRRKLAHALGLKLTQRIALAQTIGHAVRPEL